MWLFGVEAGFTGFMLCLFGLVWRGFERSGRARPSAPLWLLAAALSFGLMCFALPRVPRPDNAVLTEAGTPQPGHESALPIALPIKMRHPR